MRWSVMMLLVLLETASSADSRTRADQLFDEGRRHLAEGKYGLACAAFERSHDADPAIGTQLNIGLCYEKWGRAAAAYRAYVEAERLALRAKDQRRSAARKKVAELEAKIARLVVVVPETDGRPTYSLDGVELAPEKLINDLILDPGEHVLEVHVRGAPAIKKTVNLSAGTRTQIDLELPVAPTARPSESEPTAPTPISTTPPRRSRSKPRLFGGLGVLTVGVGLIGYASYGALGARSDYNAAIANCPDAMCGSRADFDATRDAKDRARAMTFFFAGGVAAVAIGGVLMATSKRSRAADRITLVPLGRGGIGAAIGGAL